MGLQMDFLDSDLDWETTQKNGYMKIFDLSKYEGHLTTVELIQKITHNSVSHDSKSKNWGLKFNGF